MLVGVAFRKFGDALVWYDEVASVLLAWLTYYGAALATLSRSHIGVPTLVNRLRGRSRLVAMLMAETVVIAFFAVLAWAGLRVMTSLGGLTLVSLPWIPMWLVHSVIPVGAALFMLAELLTIPDVLVAGRPIKEEDGGGR